MFFNLEESMNTFVRSETTEHAVILDMLVKEISDKLAVNRTSNSGTNKNDTPKNKSGSNQGFKNIEKTNFEDIFGHMTSRKNIEVNDSNSIKVQCWIRQSDNKNTGFYIMSFKKISDMRSVTTNDFDISPVKEKTSKSQILDNPMFIKKNSKSSLSNLYKKSGPLNNPRVNEDRLTGGFGKNKGRPESSDLIDGDHKAYSAVVSFLKSRLVKFRISSNLKMSLIIALMLIFISFGTLIFEFANKLEYVKAVKKQKEMIYNFAILKKSVSLLCATNFLQSNSTFERLWDHNPSYHEYIVR
jgi:hypothetical protein